MRNSLLIAVREWKERISSRSFLLFSIIGPLVVLSVIYLFFTYGSQPKQHWKVLISDSQGIMSGRMAMTQDEAIEYSFIKQSVEIDEFRDAKKYQGFDALLEVNEKVFTNKAGFVFFREEPSVRMQIRVQYQFERRLEEVLVEEFTDLTIKEYRKIKQPLTVSFKNVYDPNDEATNLTGWMGFAFGTIIFVFIFLYGMTILRSVSREKSNRIVEVILASVSPKQLMFGKIIGIGFAAFIQFVIWITIIAVGLYFMRELVFTDMLDASNMNVRELSIQAADQSFQEQYLSSRDYNQFVELVYQRINFPVMISFFFVFFLFGYLFYGALFAAIGATMGSESDGQQFVLPLIFILVLALYSGYYVLNYPETGMATFLHYLPFTSPVVVLVKLAQGYGAGESFDILFSLLILIVSSIAVLGIASRFYKNGILQFGHRVRLKHLLKWMKKT